MSLFLLWFSSACPTAIDCGDPGQVPHGSRSGYSFLYNESVHFICALGYRLNGAASLTCFLNGSWSAPLPVCHLIYCRSLTAPQHGAVSASSAAFGSMAPYSCVLGYQLSGNSVLTCTSSGNWDSDPPRCVAVVCPTLHDLPNVVLAYQDVTFQGQAVYVCSTGFVLTSGNLNRSCSAAATWTGTMPRCDGT